jgi:hypothetical protein
MSNINPSELCDEDIADLLEEMDDSGDTQSAGVAGILSTISENADDNDERPASTGFLICCAEEIIKSAQYFIKQAKAIEKNKGRVVMHIYLVEHDVTNLFGEFLTEAMVIAANKSEALAAAYALRDNVNGFGLKVYRKRLTATDFGLAPSPLPEYCYRPRWKHGESLILSVGTGKNDDVIRGDDEDDDYEDLRLNDALGLND